MRMTTRLTCQSPGCFDWSFDDMPRTLMINKPMFHPTLQERAAASKKYDITALATIVCQHNTVLNMFNVTTGEKWTYAGHAIVEQLVNVGHVKSWLYDINCRWDSYMRRLLAELAKRPGMNRVLLEAIMTPNPPFHTYMHALFCQLRNGYIYTDGVGRLAGEPTEIFNAEIANFSSVLKTTGTAGPTNSPINFNFSSN